MEFIVGGIFDRMRLHDFIDARPKRLGLFIGFARPDFGELRKHLRAGDDDAARGHRGDADSLATQIGGGADRAVLGHRLVQTAAYSVRDWQPANGRHLQRQSELQALGFSQANHHCCQVAPLFVRGREQAVTAVIADGIYPRATAQGSQEVGRTGTFFSTVSKKGGPHV